MKALEKLPADRWHTAHEFADALTQWPSVAIPTGARTPGAYQMKEQSRTNFSSRRVLVVAGAFVAGIALAFLAAWRIGASSGAASLSFVIEPPTYNGVRQAINDFALSPDGQTIALVASSESINQAYLRRLSEPNAVPIAGTNNAARVEWSPDGKWLGVVTWSGRLLKARADGAAAPITLARCAPRRSLPLRSLAVRGLSECEGARDEEHSVIRDGSFGPSPRVTVSLVASIAWSKMWSS